MLQFAINGKVVNTNKEKGEVEFDNYGNIISMFMLRHDIDMININQEYLINVQFECLDNEEYKAFGFLDKNNQKLFNEIYAVSGIGMKAAAVFIDDAMDKGMKANDIRFEISVGNEEPFRDTRGLSSKTLSRIMQELKDKIAIDINENGLVGYQKSGVIAEADMMLKSLGFIQSDIDKALGMITHSDNETSMEIVQAVISVLQKI